MGGMLALAPTALADADGDFFPVDPERLLDTRTGSGITHISPADTIPAGNNGKAAAGQITRVQAASLTNAADGVDVPADAVAVSLTVTGVDSTDADNYLTVWDCTDTPDQPAGGTEPDPPVASNLNLAVTDIRANAVVTNVGTGSAEDLICIYSRRATHLVVDITGYWPTGSATQLSLGAPTRKLDTRPASRVNYDAAKPVTNQVISVKLGTAAETAIVNMTGVEGVGGYITAWDCTDKNPPNDGHGNAYPEPDPPTASSLNIEPNIIAANLALVKLQDGYACFFVSAATHLVVDLLGTIPTGADYTGLASPARVMETRTGAGSPNTHPKFTAGKTVRLDLAGVTGDAVGQGDIPDASETVALNVTGTQSNDGYVTVYPCGDESDPEPNVSNLNLKQGQSRAAGVISKLEDGGVCIFTQNPTHLVVDIVGYFIP